MRNRSEYDSVLILEDLELPVRLPNNRVFMAGICRRDEAGRQLEDAEPDRDEHIFVIMLVNLVVHSLQTLLRRVTQQKYVVEKRLCDHHVHGSRNTFSGDIRHDKGEMIIVYQEEIVEIAGNLLCRYHGGINIEIFSVRVSRKIRREH